MHLISLRLLAHRYIGVFVKIHERSAQTVNGNVGQPERSFSATEHMLKTSMHCMGVYKRMGKRALYGSVQRMGKRALYGNV